MGLFGLYLDHSGAHYPYFMKSINFEVRMNKIRTIDRSIVGPEKGHRQSKTAHFDGDRTLILTSFGEFTSWIERSRRLIVCGCSDVPWYRSQVTLTGHIMYHSIIFVTLPTGRALRKSRSGVDSSVREIL